MFTAFLKNHLFLFEFWRKWESLWDVVGSLFSWNRRVNRCVKLWHHRSEIQRVFWRHHSFPCFKNKNKTTLTNKQTTITDINICSSQWDGNQVTKLGCEDVLDTWLHWKDRVFSLPPKQVTKAKLTKALALFIPNPSVAAWAPRYFLTRPVSWWADGKGGSRDFARMHHSDVAQVNADARQVSHQPCSLRRRVLFGEGSCLDKWQDHSIWVNDGQHPKHVLV